MTHTDTRHATGEQRPPRSSLTFLFLPKSVPGLVEARSSLVVQTAALSTPALPHTCNHRLQGARAWSQH